jgi:flagellar basal body-associated protein FliL
MKLLFMLGMMLSGAVLASGGGESGGGGAAGMLKMEPLVVNLQGGRFINFSSQLKLADPAEEVYVKAYMPALRHEMIKGLLGQNATTVQSTEFIGSYSHQVTEILNKFLKGEYVKDVFFDNWMVR